MDAVDRFAEDHPGARGRQRARGEARAVFAQAGARTEAARFFETGGLRLRFPNGGPDREVVLVNTGGGMAGGDRVRVDFSLQPGARVFATTQSAEKIYRADGAATEVALHLSVSSGASLIWAPQETLFFEGASLHRRLEAEVAPDASLLILEAAVFGRIAHGETRIDATFRDDWRIRRENKLVFAEAVRLTEAASVLDRLAAGNGARAVATLLWLAPQAPAHLDRLRAILEGEMEAAGERLEAGAGALDGGLIARLLSPAPQRLRTALVAVLDALVGRETPRVWR